MPLHFPTLKTYNYIVIYQGWYFKFNRAPIPASCNMSGIDCIVTKLKALLPYNSPVPLLSRLFHYILINQQTFHPFYMQLFNLITVAFEATQVVCPRKKNSKKITFIFNALLIYSHWHFILCHAPIL